MGENNLINLAICCTGELYGGVEQFISTFSDYLKKETNVRFIVLLFNKGLLYEKLKEAEIETYIIHSRFKYNLGIIKQSIKLFKEKKINVVHTHGYKANILCSIAATACNVKIVKTEHGKMEPPTGYSGFKMQINLKIDRLISRLLLDEIIFVSKDIESYYKKYYKNIKSTVIYNGIPWIKVNSDIKLQDFDYNTFNIGIVGRLSKVKGHIYLLKAIKHLEELRDIRLYIFGEGCLKDGLKNYCLENGISDRVFFMGFKNNIYDYIYVLDLFVMPSMHEGLPYALLEAMFLKIPIIASNVGGLKEILENDTDALLVPPLDEKSLANAIRHLYLNLKIRKHLVNNAYKKVSELFLLNQMAAKYLNIYRRCISEYSG